MTQEQLINIPLGESVVNGKWDILRVIGGWVYSQLFYEHNGLCGADLVINSSLTSIFVPELKPEPIVSRFIHVTKSGDVEEISINIDGIQSVQTGYDRTSSSASTLISYTDGKCIFVYESYDEVMAMIQAREGTK